MLATADGGARPATLGPFGGTNDVDHFLVSISKGESPQPNEVDGMKTV